MSFVRRFMDFFGYEKIVRTREIVKHNGGLKKSFLKLFFSRCNHIVISRCKSTFFSLILLGNTLPLCHGAWTIKEYQSTVHVNRELCKSHKKYAEVEWKVEKKKNLWRFLVWLKWVHKVSMARNLCCDWNEKQERAREKK